MRRAIIALLPIVVLAGCGKRAAAGYAFTEIAHPEAKSTMASGINVAGHVVGWYEQRDRTYGFLLKDGEYSTIQYPDAALTQLYGINDNGDISGGFRMPDEASPFAYHGFVMTRSGEFRHIRHADYKYGMAMRVLADGSVIGCFHQDDMPSMRSMTVRANAIDPAGIPADAVTLLDTPGSMHNGGTPDGTKVVGALTGTREAYVIDRGALTTFTAPGATRTEAWDVNESGVIVGVYETADSTVHGFVLENGTYTTIDYPDAKRTVTFGINARGEIVGGFSDASGARRAYRAVRR